MFQLRGEEGKGIDPPYHHHNKIGKREMAGLSRIEIYQKKSSVGDPEGAAIVIWEGPAGAEVQKKNRPSLTSQGIFLLVLPGRWAGKINSPAPGA